MLRFATLARWLGLVATISPISGNAQSPPVFTYPQQEFRLLVGEGADVCESYVTRLNQSEFSNYAYCDRPENDSIEGFQRLGRAPLNSDEVARLWLEVEGFVNQGDPNFFQRVASDRIQRGLDPYPRVPQGYLDNQRTRMRLGYTPLFYRFDPKVDIDNDGTPDDVLVWKQTGITCGSVEAVNSYRSPTRAATRAVLLDGSGHVDAMRTRKVFGHPMGDFFTYRDRDGNERTLKWQGGFRTVGYSFGIFSFRDQVYFDTFYGSTGDAQNQRVEAPDITNTLAVFRRSGDTTQLVCELSWRDPYVE